jgi:hypothetical protein
LLNTATQNRMINAQRIQQAASPGERFSVGQITDKVRIRHDLLGGRLFVVTAEPGKRVIPTHLILTETEIKLFGNDAERLPGAVFGGRSHPCVKLDAIEASLFEPTLNMTTSDFIKNFLQ